MKAGFLYMMASHKNETIYIGSTSNLIQRVVQHRDGAADGFTREHGCKLLVWFDTYDDLQYARQREVQMKEWKRSWKIKRIEERNLEWVDLYPTLL